MIYVNNTHNQLNVRYDNRTDVYSFDSIKSISHSLGTNGNYYVTINFIANDKNNSFRIPLNEVDPALFWTNDLAGAEYAVDMISKWMDHNLNVAIVSPIGKKIMDESIPVTIAIDELGVQRATSFLRPSGVAGSTPDNVFSVSFASVGTANATVGGITLKPGETLNFDAGAINNYLGAIPYSTTTAGAELIIITIA